MPICRIITLQNEQEWAKAGQWLKERAHPGGNNDVENQVRDILNNVRSHGDAALAEYTMKFDCPDFSGDIRVSPQEIEMAAATVPAEDRECIAQAASNIRAFHEIRRKRAGSPPVLMEQSWVRWSTLLPVSACMCPVAKAATRLLFPVSL